MAAEWITRGDLGIRIDVVPSGDVFDVPAAVRRQARAARVRSGPSPSGPAPGSSSRGRTTWREATSGSRPEVSEIADGEARPRPRPATAARRTRCRPSTPSGARSRRRRGAPGPRRGRPLERDDAAEVRGVPEFQLGAEKFGADAEAAERTSAGPSRSTPISSCRGSPRLELPNQGRWEEGARDRPKLDPRRSRLTAFNRISVDAVRAILAGRYDEVLGRSGKRRSCPG